MYPVGNLRGSNDYPGVVAELHVKEIGFGLFVHDGDILTNARGGKHPDKTKVNAPAVKVYAVDKTCHCTD